MDIQLVSIVSCVLTSSPSRRTKYMHETIKEAKIARVPMVPIIFSFFIFLPSSPFIRKPRRGKNGMSHILSYIYISS
jgi:hypothetical protein